MDRIDRRREAMVEENNQKKKMLIEEDEMRSERRKNLSCSIEEFPEHIMELIVKRLCLPDLFRFGCVCKGWGSISDPLRFANHLPWLILPRSFDVGFYSLRDNTVYKLEFPQLFNRQIRGSLPGGWLMTAHHNSEIQLFKPFSCSSSSPIYLPPLTGFPRVLRTRIDVDGQLIYQIRTVGGVCRYSGYRPDTYINRAALSTTGSIVMVIHNDSSSLAYYRIQPGNQQFWTPVTKDAQSYFHPITRDTQCYYHDLAYYKRNFYAVQHTGRVIVIHGLEEPHHVYPGIHIEQILPPYHNNRGSFQHYILECAGNLLVVFRNFTSVDFSLEVPTLITVGFEVRKIELGSLRIFRFPPAANKWVDIDNLGDYSLFISPNTSFSVPASKFSGCKPNCIYFIDTLRTRTAGRLCRGYALGIFNLQDGTIDKFLFPTDDLPVTSTPVWFAPNLA